MAYICADVTPWNALWHYGVKGMKWGVRRTKEQIRHDLDKQKEKHSDTPVADYIQQGKVLVEVNANKQLRHIKSSSQYVKGRSYIYGDLETAKQLVKDLHLTGEVWGEGDWDRREHVVSERDIGVYVDPDTHKRHKTNAATIAYSKTGTHIIPARPRKG